MNTPQTVKGNILKSQCEILTNPVNTHGISGAGLAAQIKKAYPQNHHAYNQACRNNQLRVGQILIHQLTDPTNPHIPPPYWICNFPTKADWRKPSRLSYITTGLKTLAKTIPTINPQPTSISVPMLGCGLGGLNPDTVEHLIREHLKPIPNLQVLIYRN